MDASSVIELSVDSFSVGLGDESVILNIDSTLPDKIRCIIADVNGRTFDMNNISTARIMVRFRLQPAMTKKNV